MDNEEYIKSIGWKELFFWNNRQLYTIGDKKYCLFIHLHDNAVGYAIFKPDGDFLLKYSNLTHEQIKEYTKRVLSYGENIKNIETLVGIR